MMQRTIHHPELKAWRVIKALSASDLDILATLQFQAWDIKWQRIRQANAKRAEVEKAAHLSFQKKELALERTREAQKQIDDLGNLLRESVELDHVIDWNSLKSRSPFSTPPPGIPSETSIPPPPVAPGALFKPVLILGFWDKVIPSRGAQKRAAFTQKVAQAREQFKDEERLWGIASKRIQKLNEDRRLVYVTELKKWETEKVSYERLQLQLENDVDALRVAYQEKKSEVIADYCELVLSRSEYPDSFPRSFSLEYLPKSKVLVLDYHLPDVSCLPTLKELKYVASRDQFQHVYVSDAWLNRIYDDVLYQITLRTVNELFQADSIDALGTVAFNGWVNSINKSTGQEENACILSLQVTKNEFKELNLINVEAKACFRKLKGVSASKLVSLSPIKPILRLNKEDHRFVPSYEVAADLNDSVNLAAMDWLDFENLIREIFEKEFSRNGGEVKITQASRDGGVDAIAFDPDPIRGGKIVIQAKRYTNPVGVSAVRDLYGTVHNEGATKGILVTTSDYGPDAYEFAKGKPLTLLSGGELLHLLQKHGHRAKINLAEAKQLLAEQDQSQQKSRG